MLQKIKLLITTTLTLSLFNSFAQNDWEKMDLKGKVKSLSIEQSSKHKTKYVFNQNGQIIRKQVFLFSELQTDEKYKYQNGKLIAIKNNINHTNRKFYYDKFGNMIEQSNGTKYLYIYDSNHKKIEMNGYNKQGEKFITVQYKYDENGKLSERKENYKNHPKNTKTYNYIIKNKLLIQKTVKNYINNKLKDSEITNYYYNKDSRIIKKVEVSGKNRYVKNYTYDAKLNWIKEESQKKWIPSTIRKIEYH